METWSKFGSLEVALLVGKCWEIWICSFHFTQSSQLHPIPRWIVELVNSWNFTFGTWRSNLVKKHQKTPNDFRKFPTNSSTKFPSSRWSASPTRGPFWRGGSDVPQMGFGTRKTHGINDFNHGLSCWNSTFMGPWWKSGHEKDHQLGVRGGFYGIQK